MTDCAKVDDILRTVRHQVKAPDRLDTVVLREAGLRTSKPARSFVVPVVSLLSLAAAVLAILLLPAAVTEYQCRRTLAILVRAVESRDVPTALSLCAVGEEPAALIGDGLRRFYERYPSVRYELVHVRIRTDGRSALATTEYRLIASGADGELRRSGTDRLYMERGPDGRFRIHHWIDG